MLELCSALSSGFAEDLPYNLYILPMGKPQDLGNRKGALHLCVTLLVVPNQQIQEIQTGI